MTSLPNIDPQQLATIVAAVMASLGTVPQTAVYDETDIEGKPLQDRRTRRPRDQADGVLQDLRYRERCLGPVHQGCLP